MDQSQQPSSHVVQSLEVIEKDGDNAELRIKTDDEASSLLWAAQWLDEHREFSVVGIRLDTESTRDVEGDCTSTLIIELGRSTRAHPGDSARGRRASRHCTTHLTTTMTAQVRRRQRSWTN